jgi:hypothetical protein
MRLGEYHTAATRDWLSEKARARWTPEQREAAGSRATIQWTAEARAKQRDLMLFKVAVAGGSRTHR